VTAARVQPVLKRKQPSVHSRVGTVTFEPATEISLAESNLEATKSQRVRDMAALNGFEYVVGPLNGVVRNGSVTFRSEIRFFHFNRQWHVVPVKYNHLPEEEMHRRMKIKVRNSGKKPWNAGVQWSQETRQNIREKTVVAMQRKDVIGNYQRHHYIRLSMAEAAARKRKLKKQVEKEARMKQRREARRSNPKPPRRRKKAASKPKKPRRHPNLGKSLSAEQKRRISESVRRRWMDPAFREKVLKGRRNRSTEGHSPKKSQANTKKDTEDESREKYNALMETVAKLADEVTALEAQRELVKSDAEVTREVDAALDRSRTLIETVREAVKEVEERLGIRTSPLNVSPIQIDLSNGYQADSDTDRE